LAVWPSSALQLTRILKARHLHHDAIIALADDRRLRVPSSSMRLRTITSVATSIALIGRGRSPPSVGVRRCV
jgi:hypothetical protein